MMRDRALAAADPHKADLVWQPWEHLENSWEKQRQGTERSPVNRAWQAGGQMGRLVGRWAGWVPQGPALNVISCCLPDALVNPVDDLLTAACSSIFPGAGTNQELALHYLHESRGDILVSKPC